MSHTTVACRLSGKVEEARNAMLCPATATKGLWRSGGEEGICSRYKLVPVLSPDKKRGTCLIPAVAADDTMQRLETNNEGGHV